MSLSSLLNLRLLALDKVPLPQPSRLHDPLVWNATHGVCLNPFKTELPRYDARYTLTYDGTAFRDNYGKEVCDMKAASAPLPEPLFYGAEWFECEQDAIDRLDQIKTRFVYRSHAIRPYDDVGRFLLEITF